MKLGLVKFFILISMLQGLFFMIGVSNAIFKLLILSFTVLIFLNSINKKLKFTKTNSLAYFSFLFYIYAAIIIVSAIVNKSDFIKSFSYLFYLVPAFTLYIYLIKMNLNENSIIKLNNFIFYIFGFQILFSIYKLLFLGTSEAIAGTIHFSAGSYNTILPLVAISMLISFYSFYKNNYIYLFFVLGFLFMSWVGEKRGIYFYLFVLLFIHYISLNKFQIFSFKSFKRLLFFLPFIFLIIFFGVKYSPTLNPEQIMGGSFDLNYIYDYAFNYSTQVDSYGYSGGRFSGIKTIFNSVSSGDYVPLFIGSGPDQIIGINDDSIEILERYMLQQDIGINGWSTALISIGFIGVLITILFYFHILRTAYFTFKFEKDIYWKSLSYGLYLMMIVFFLDFFTYTRSFYHHIGLNIVVLYFYSIISLRRINSN